MTPDDLDRILSSEDLLEPSSEFAMEVMAAVRRHAAEPSPLLFPWFRFAAGLAASGAMAVAGTVLLLPVRAGFCCDCRTAGSTRRSYAGARLRDGGNAREPRSHFSPMAPCPPLRFI
jgi:hypothetical protein